MFLYEIIKLFNIGDFRLSKNIILNLKISVIIINMYFS